jgi:hypothetical protein
MGGAMALRPLVKSWREQGQLHFFLITYFQNTYKFTYFLTGQAARLGQMRNALKNQIFETVLLSVRAGT